MELAGLFAYFRENFRTLGNPHAFLCNGPLDTHCPTSSFITIRVGNVGVRGAGRVLLNRCLDRALRWNGLIHDDACQGTNPPIDRRMTVFENGLSGFPSQQDLTSGRGGLAGAGHGHPRTAKLARKDMPKRNSCPVGVHPRGGYPAQAIVGDEWYSLPPFVLVQRRILVEHCSLSPGARLVALAIAKHLGRDDDKINTFVGNERLSEETGLSTRSVRHKVNELRRLRPPLFIIKRGGFVRGYSFKCNSFELVRDPSALELAWRQKAVSAVQTQQVPNRLRMLLQAHDEPVVAAPTLAGTNTE